MEKSSTFNTNYPIYDNQQIEIVGIREKKFDKISTVFNSIGHGFSATQKRQKLEDILRSLHVSYLGK